MGLTFRYLEVKTMFATERMLDKVDSPSVTSASSGGMPLSKHLATLVAISGMRDYAQLMCRMS